MGELSPGNGQVIMNFQSPQGAIDAAVTVPTQEDGTVLFDMPLSSPSEEVRLARQLEYHQWPDHLELECSELVDFDLDRLQPWGSPRRNTSPRAGRWIRSCKWRGTAPLALVRTEEPYDGPTCWFPWTGRRAGLERVVSLQRGRGLYGTRTTLGPPSSEKCSGLSQLCSAL